MSLLWTESGFAGHGFLGLGYFYLLLCSAWSALVESPVLACLPFKGLDRDLWFVYNVSSG